MYGAQFSVTAGNVDLYFLPWNSRKDLKFYTQLASAFSLHMESYRLLNADFSRITTKIEASFVGPVLGHKKMRRFLKILKQGF